MSEVPIAALVLFGLLLGWPFIQLVGAALYRRKVLRFVELYDALSREAVQEDMVVLQELLTDARRNNLDLILVPFAVILVPIAAAGAVLLSVAKTGEEIEREAKKDYEELLALQRRLGYHEPTSRLRCDPRYGEATLLGTELSVLRYPAACLLSLMLLAMVAVPLTVIAALVWAWRRLGRTSTPVTALLDYLFKSATLKSAHLRMLPLRFSHFRAR